MNGLAGQHTGSMFIGILPVACPCFPAGQMIKFSVEKTQPDNPQRVICRINQALLASSHMYGKGFYRSIAASICQRQYAGFSWLSACPPLFPGYPAVNPVAPPNLRVPERIPVPGCTEEQGCQCPFRFCHVSGKGAISGFRHSCPENRSKHARMGSPCKGARRAGSLSTGTARPVLPRHAQTFLSRYPYRPRKEQAFPERPVSRYPPICHERIAQAC